MVRWPAGPPCQPNLQPIVTEEIRPRFYCRRCDRQVQAKLPEVLPECTLGNRDLVLTAMMHYLQGLRLLQTVDMLQFHLRMGVTVDGLVAMWQRLADHFQPWYQQIHESALSAPVLHAGETGWRKRGVTHWLWCFASKREVY